jgi:hypothetical protein
VEVLVIEMLDTLETLYGVSSIVPVENDYRMTVWVHGQVFLNHANVLFFLKIQRTGHVRNSTILLRE